MKKHIQLFTALIMICTLSACGNETNVDYFSSNTPQTQTLYPSSPEFPQLFSPLPPDIAAQQPEPFVYPDADDFVYSDLADIYFWFGSGAGAWCTVVNIHSDGTFDGYYHDSNSGDVGDSYPGGTRYECFFSGKFSALNRIGDYEYSMVLEFMKTEGTFGEEIIKDGVKITTSTPYGFDNAFDFSLYLPGISISELSEEFLSWSQGFGEDGVLTCYGLYNVGGQQGYIVWPDLEFKLGF